MKPPAYIDEARVIKWAWSGLEPFGYVGTPDDPKNEEVYGLAICQYEKSGKLYRFSCNKNWETVQDSPYGSVEDAIRFLPVQYKNIEADWKEI